MGTYKPVSGGQERRRRAKTRESKAYEGERSVKEVTWRYANATVIEDGYEWYLVRQTRRSFSKTCEGQGGMSYGSREELVKWSENFLLDIYLEGLGNRKNRTRDSMDI